MFRLLVYSTKCFLKRPYSLETLDSAAVLADGRREAAERFARAEEERCDHSLTSVAQTSAVGSS